MSIVNNKKIIFPLLAALAFVLLISSGTGIVNAYFTTYVTADSWNTVSLETEITVMEELHDIEKTVTLENTGECDCWVRLRAILPPGFEPYYNIGNEWVLKEDGFYYYTAQLPAGYKTSAPFVVGVRNTPKVNGETPPEFNIVVIAESIPCAGVDETYDRADWNLQAEVVED